MPEVQLHGFMWENDLLTNVYNKSKNINYTSKYDLPCYLNSIDPTVNISIKTTGTSNTVCMGDALRVYDETTSGEKLHMIVVEYRQIVDTKRLICIAEIDLTNSKEVLFGSLNRDDVAELDRLIKSIPQKRRPTAEEKSLYVKKQKELIAKSGAITFNPKCNSQQSRLQCSFNKFQKFLEENPERVIAKSVDGIFRGYSVMQTIQSARRVFKRI